MKGNSNDKKGILNQKCKYLNKNKTKKYLYTIMKYTNINCSLNNLAIEQSVVQWQDDSSTIQCYICKLIFIT